MSGEMGRLMRRSKNAPSKKKPLKRTKKLCASYAAGLATLTTTGAANTALRLATGATDGASALIRAMTYK